MKRWLSLAFLCACLFALTACTQPNRPAPPPPAVWVDCPDCAGKGWHCHDGVCDRCKRCSGTGKVRLQPAPAPAPDTRSTEGKRPRRPRR